MSASSYQVRRATLDDLDTLRQLWAEASVSTVELEKSLTDFQIIEESGGAAVGCIAIKIDSRQGCIYAEALRAGAPAADLRQRLWDRLQILARNHQLIRLWTQQTGSFWDAHGFVTPTEKIAATRPASFVNRSAAWRCLQLREQVESALSLEKEFELFVQGEKDASARAIRQAQWLKYLAWTILVSAMCALAYYGFRILVKISSK